MVIKRLIKKSLVTKKRGYNVLEQIKKLTKTVRSPFPWMLKILKECRFSIFKILNLVCLLTSPFTNLLSATSFVSFLNDWATGTS